VAVDRRDGIYKWGKLMGANKSGYEALRKGRVSISGQIYHVTTTTRDRRPFFADFATACAAARCFTGTQLLGDTTLLAWVLMPDHVHWLFQLGAGSLPALVDRLKSASAREANRADDPFGPVWAKGFYDHALRREEDIQGVARYIVANPLRVGLARRVGDYPFWGAVWL